MPKNKKKTPLPQDLEAAGQKVFLAGLGALSVAEKEGKKYFKKLVKKGEKYDGPGHDQAAALRQQAETRFGQARHEVDEQALKARKALEGQVTKVKEGVDTLVDGLEDRIEQAVTAALHGLGVPTRDEIAELRRSVRQLSKNLDALRHEREIEDGAEPAIQAHATGNGWYEIRVRGVAVDKVHGEDEATELVARLQQEDAALTAAERAAAPTAQAVGGGWYQIRVNGLVVGKVQGKDEAEAAVARLTEQEAA